MIKQELKTGNHQSFISGLGIICFANVYGRIGLAEMISNFKDQRILTIPKGQILLYPGDSAEYIYYIISGLVKCFTINDNGDEPTILFLAKDMFMPSHPNMLTYKPFLVTFFYISFTELEVYKIPKAEFNELVNKDHELLMDISVRLLKMHEEALRHILALQSKTSREKVNISLEYICRILKTVNNDVKFTRQEIGNLSGLTRETVTQILAYENKTTLNEN